MAGSPDTTRTIRLFHVEDKEMDRVAIQSMCELTPEQDLVYAGWEAANPPDLPEKVAAAAADLALVDLLLTRGPSPDKILDTPSTSGIDAVRSLHRKFGSKLKIMVLTDYPEKTPRALDAGANTVVDKTISFDELRQAIRDLASGRTPPPYGIGELRSLDIFAGSDGRHFVVWGELGKTPELTVQPLPMTFLVYLAEEKRIGQGDFLKRTGLGMAPTQKALWESIVRQLESARGLDPGGVLLDPARWAAQINEEIRPYMAQSASRLIIGPQKRGAHATYHLNPDIGEIRFLGAYSAPGRV